MAERGLTNLANSVDVGIKPWLRLRLNKGLVAQVGNTRQKPCNYHGLVPDTASCMAFRSMLLDSHRSRAGTGLFSSAFVRSLCERAVGEERRILNEAAPCAGIGLSDGKAWFYPAICGMREILPLLHHSELCCADLGYSDVYTVDNSFTSITHSISRLVTIIQSPLSSTEASSKLRNLPL